MRKKSYFDLVRQFALVPIRDEGQYDAALAFLKTLAVRDETTLDAGERDYLDALTQFVGDYEDQHLRPEMGMPKRQKTLPVRRKRMARTLTHKDVPDCYAELVALLMPRPLHDDVDYRNALGVLDAMAGFEMNADQQDYFEAIATFVEKYEAEHHAFEQGTTTNNRSPCPRRPKPVA